MAITVKKLIAELEKLPNKFAEVEVVLTKSDQYSKELDERITLFPGKVILTVKPAPKY